MFLGGAPGCATSLALAQLSIAAEKAEAWGISYALCKIDLSRAFAHMLPHHALEHAYALGCPPELCLGMLRECIGQELWPSLDRTRLVPVPLSAGSPEGGPTLRAIVTSHRLKDPCEINSAMEKTRMDFPFPTRGELMR